MHGMPGVDWQVRFCVAQKADPPSPHSAPVQVFADELYPMMPMDECMPLQYADAWLCVRMHDVDWTGLPFTQQ